MKNMDNKLIIYLLMIVLLFNFVDAQSDIGTFEQGTDINLIQTCSSCTFNNITIIKLANGELLTINQPMTKQGTFYNYTLNSTYTNSLGEYIINGIGDPSGVNTIWGYTLFVTPSGGDPLSSGQSIILFSALGIIFLLGLAAMYGGFAQKETSQSKKIFAKALFFSLGGVMILISILFALLLLNEAVAYSPKLVEGFETFYFVIKIIGSLGILSLIIISCLIMLKAWKIKRGLR